MTPTTFASGGSVTLSGSFSDNGANDAPWKYGYLWGDGTPQSTGTLSAQGSVPGASHTYPSAGTYLVQLRVTDKDGKAGFSKKITITVTP
ncbi:MAG: PKD domain-containing protein [Gemmatimonadota bacterium]|nr:PKD domain-containing protein [Gemmatimonadota bacterium]